MAKLIPFFRIAKIAPAKQKNRPSGKLSSRKNLVLCDIHPLLFNLTNVYVCYLVLHIPPIFRLLAAKYKLKPWPNEVASYLKSDENLHLT